MTPFQVFFRQLGSISLLTLALIFFICSIWLSVHTRMEVAEQVVNFLKQPERLVLLNTQYLTPVRFRLLLAAMLLAAFTFLLLTYLFRTKFLTLWILMQKAWEAVQEFKLNTKECLQNLSRKEKLLAAFTFFFLLILKAWLANWFTAHTDEAYSYLHFVREGFLKTIAYYPLPNNHVFYNFLSGFVYLFRLPPLWVVRTVTFVVSLLLSVLLFLIGLRRSSFTTAYLMAVFFSAAPYSLYYSVNGRGYMLLSLFALLAAYTVLRFCETYRNRYLIIFILSSALGFFTVPVFAYCFLPLVIFGSRYVFSKGSGKIRFRFVAAVVGAGALTLLLYSPILLTSGWHVFFGRDVQQQAGKDFGSNYLPYLKFLFTGFSGWGVVGYLLPALAFMILLKSKSSSDKRRNNLAAQLLFIFLLCPVVSMGISRVLPPERSWLFWIIAVSVLMAVASDRLFIYFNLKANMKYFLTAFLGLAFFVLQFFNLKAKVATGEIQVFWPLPRIIPEVVNGRAKHVYSEHEFYELFMQLGRDEKHTDIDIDIYSFEPAKNYDYVLILKDKPFPPSLPARKYNLVFKDHLVKAYKRNDL